LEYEIELLKRENSKIMQSKLEKEIELEKLRAFISRNEGQSPMSVMFPSYQELDPVRARS